MNQIKKLALSMPAMTDAEYAQMMKVRLDKISHLVERKLSEYGGDNALKTFKQAAAETGDTMHKALDGMLRKHTASYKAMLDDLNDGRLPTEEYVEEKFGDIQLYFIIQEIQFKHLINCVKTIDAQNAVKAEH